MTSTKKKPVPKCNQSSKWKRGVRERIAVSVRRPHLPLTRQAWAAF